MINGERLATLRYLRVRAMVFRTVLSVSLYYPLWMWQMGRAVCQGNRSSLGVGSLAILLWGVTLVLAVNVLWGSLSMEALACAGLACLVAMVSWALLLCRGLRRFTAAGDGQGPSTGWALLWGGFYLQGWINRQKQHRVERFKRAGRLVR